MYEEELIPSNLTLEIEVEKTPQADPNLCNVLKTGQNEAQLCVASSLISQKWEWFEVTLELKCSLSSSIYILNLVKRELLPQNQQYLKSRRKKRSSINS